MSECDPPRPARLCLPDRYPWAIGQVVTDAGPFHTCSMEAEHSAALVARLQALLPSTRILADPVTRRAASHAMVSFRPALDELARYLWQNFRTYIGEPTVVMPPCNFLMDFQSAFIRLAETIQAVQDFDAAQHVDQELQTMPSKLLNALESVLRDYSRMQADLGHNAGRPIEAVLPGEANAKGKHPTPKRSTERGEARAKLIAALTKHHQYADDGCLNGEPIGNNELARLAKVDRATASAFFKQEFKGHGKYRAACADSVRLVAALKLLNGEYAPHLLYGSKPPEKDERCEE